MSCISFPRRSRAPINEDEPVETAVVLGPGAKRPLRVSSPIMIAGMSYGAVSRNVKLVIARAAGSLGIGFNSGEGGILEEEYEAGGNCLIGQYSTALFPPNEAALKRVAAVELRFGQGAYPGKGSYVPAEKLTDEVLKTHGLKMGDASRLPARHADLVTPRQIKEKVAALRGLTDGVPVGAKIGCGDIERDLEVLIDAEIDFVAIDGFGGGTGATSCAVRENVGLPLLAALPRAVRFLSEKGVKDRVSVIAGGGLRTAADFAKCLALGADAVYVGTAALIAINCQQYRICHTGLCPTGTTTNNPVLMKQIDIEEGVRRLVNFLRVSTADMAELARAAGKDDLGKLDNDDVVSLSRDLARLARVKWLDGRLP